MFRLSITINLYEKYLTRSCLIGQRILVFQCIVHYLLDMGIQGNCNLAIEKDRIEGNYIHNIHLEMDHG
jgi:hypothetical protein